MMDSSLTHTSAEDATTRKFGTIVVACQAARKCGYEVLPHPPYSPDLAPSDFFLFPHLKSTLRGRHFNTDNDVIAVTEEYFSSKNSGFYKEGIRKMKNRWEKCVTLAGSYIEKEQ